LPLKIERRAAVVVAAVVVAAAAAREKPKNNPRLPDTYTHIHKHKTFSKIYFVGRPSIVVDSGVGAVSDGPH
jgi:hypothetical protein